MDLELHIIQWNEPHFSQLLFTIANLPAFPEYTETGCYDN